MSTDPARIPVIVGVGQVNDRPASDEEGLDSIGLMAAAVRAADADAGGGFLSQCDWLAIVPQISFRELDPVALLPAALGIAPGHVRQAAMASGDTPILYLNEAANAVAHGEARVCHVAGGEGLRTAARRQQVSGPGAGQFRAHLTASELRIRYGVLNPAEIYALYENATRAAWGQTLAEGQAESGLLWSLMSEVAARSEGAWITTPKTAGEIVDRSADNRPITFPYSKFMVANSSVNQGAAFIVTSLEAARKAGVPEERLIYVWAGAAAHELEEPLARVAWDTPAGMRVSLERALSVNGLGSQDLDHVELYSCFPCVPKMARRVLGWPADKPATVHGGLTFGGGPIGNYMTHGVAAMVQALRRNGSQGSGNGLLFANGGHCTHNHTIVVSRHPPRAGLLGQSYDFQAEADAARGTVPPLGDSYEGLVTVETYTVVYDRSGAPDYGIVLSRAPDGSRVIAKVAGDDAEAIAFLTGGMIEPVGSAGITAKAGDTLFWRPASDTRKGNP
jgi:acetyl-CoA C-acetyltransferase